MTELELLTQIAATTGPITTLGLGLFLWLRAELAGIRRDLGEALERSRGHHDRILRLELRAAVPTRVDTDLTPVQ